MWSKGTGLKQRDSPGKVKYLPGDRQDIGAKCVETKSSTCEVRGNGNVFLKKMTLL